MHLIKLSIVIVNWNTREFLRDCLNSLMSRMVSVEYEIIVVDNASTDDSLNMLREEFPSVHLIKNSYNAGFAKANNIGIKASRGEFVLLLNPDTIVSDPGIFKEWIAFMDFHKDAGASGCKLVFPDNSHQVGDAGFKPHLGTAVNFAFFLSKIFPYSCKGLFISSDRLAKEMEVDWVCGADFMIRKSILTETGLLDETIFMYAEDVEWGCRIRSFGYKMYYIPHLQIIHLQGESLKKVKSEDNISFLWLKNLRRLYEFYNGKKSLLVYDLIMSIAFFLRTVLYYTLFLGKRDPATKKKVYRMFCYFRFSANHLFGLNG
ncbi:MAG: glycosyl transferase family 2 [Syntrophus sp. (in: bacteria)]|nr:glycosyl transferase family 2 [Syntrophus sp. (in: bacteria)]